jgi:hypothetical protein
MLCGLPVRHGVADEVHHAQVTLDGGDPWLVVHGGVDAGEQLPGGQHHDTGLTQRRQDLLDVPQEDRAGPDDQDTGAGQPLPVRVEQIGGTVQRHGGLPRARAALDHQYARDVRADDLVLLGLDGGDDVAHPARALRVEGGEQRPLPAQAGEPRLVERVEVEHVVLDAVDLAALEHQVPAPHHALGVGGGRLVERLGRRGAPVDEHAVLLVVGQADPADVEPVAVGQVQTAEDQPVLHRPQLAEPVLVQGREGVALGSALVAAGGTAATHLGEVRRGAFTQLVEPCVQLVDTVLLLGDLGPAGLLEVLARRTVPPAVTGHERVPPPGRSGERT